MHTRKTAEDRSAGLLTRLQKASEEMDGIITELRRTADERLQTVNGLEASIGKLRQREADLNIKIQGTGAVALGAALLPARRAATIDPMDSLRAE